MADYPTTRSYVVQTRRKGHPDNTWVDTIVLEAAPDDQEALYRAHEEVHKLHGDRIHRKYDVQVVARTDRVVYSITTEHV